MKFRITTTSGDPQTEYASTPRTEKIGDEYFVDIESLEQLSEMAKAYGGLGIIIRVPARFEKKAGPPILEIYDAYRE